MKRKIYDRLLEWKRRDAPRYALMIDGARRVGKSYIAEEFAKAEYEAYVLIDFSKVKKDVKELFEDYLDELDTFFMLLQNKLNVVLPRGKSLIIFDEVQRFPRAREAIKHLVKDGRYHYLETGSLISINRNAKDILLPSEELRVKMHPMDFEEFLWAMDKDILSENIREHFSTNEKMPESLHNQALDLYQKYLIVGGMPESVLKYQQTQSYLASREIQQSILAGYDKDMTKYSSPATAVKIRACFNSIPAQLAKENRKFQYKLAKKGGTATIFGEAIQWLMQSGVAAKCTLVSHGYLPLSAQVDDSDFKIYLADVGLLGAKAQIPASMLLNCIEVDNTFLGSVAENYVAQQLQALNHSLFYWKNDNTAELEFVLQIEDNIIPTEVKKGRRVKAQSMTQFMEKYKTPLAYRISGKNFGLANGVKAIPLYAVFCI